MAEGHTLLRWAKRLRPLLGKPLDIVEIPGQMAQCPWALVGERVTRIETRGKHLLLHTSQNTVIHCHAGMVGRWRMGSPEKIEKWRNGDVWLRLRTGGFEAVFLNGPVVELLEPDSLERHKTIGALGPDLLAKDFDSDEAWKRLQLCLRREIGDAILDQRIVAGIGNVYKSEGLFLAGIDPRNPVGNLSRALVEKLWNATIPLMQRGAREFGAITTLPASLQDGSVRNWVYRRTGKPCFRCGSTIIMFRQGRHKRATYFCPECQN